MSDKAAPIIGLLYPGFSAADDFPALEKRLGGTVRLPLVHTSVPMDLHEVHALQDVGNPDRLATGAEQLLPHRPGSAMWACTSGSFVFGWDGAHQQVERLEVHIGIPTSSTSIAFVNAAKALSIRRVAVAASYPRQVARHFTDFLRHGGVEVTTITSRGIETAAAVGKLSRSEMLEFVGSVDTADADAVFVPDTAMHTLAEIDALERHVGLPVLTANQVTVFEGLRLQNALMPLPGLGRLFA